MASRLLKTIACVLKSGGDFVPAHVEWLKRMCVDKMPDWEFQCWSDMDVPDCIPLTTSWPKWWAKMEIYNTRFLGPALVIDLDTVFLKELRIMAKHEDEAIIMRDPWKDGSRFAERLGGGFMYLPVWARTQIADAWNPDPDDIMAKYGGNDQPFLHDLFGKTALRFQDHYIDELVSYKAHVKSLGVREDNKVVYFHGVPRPWEVTEEWIPKLEAA